MKFPLPSSYRPSCFNDPVNRTENAANRHTQNVSQNAAPASDMHPENRISRRHSLSLFQKLCANKKEHDASTSTSTSVSANAGAPLRLLTFNETALAEDIHTVEEQVVGAVAKFIAKAGKNRLTKPEFDNIARFYINHGLNALDQKFEHALQNILPEQSPEELERTRDSAKERIIQSVYEYTIVMAKKQVVEDAAEFFSITDTLTPSTFNKKVQDYIDHGLNAIDEEFEHALQNILPGQSPEEFERTRDSEKGSLIQMINEVCRSGGWVLPDQEKSNLKWESPAGPLLIKRGLTLQQLKLNKENIAGGIYGSVSIFENESGAKLIGKISKNNMRDEQGNIVDDLANELGGYQTIYDAVGPHPNLVNAYGIAQVSIDGEMKRTLLMDEVPGPNGEIALDALRKSWKAAKISSTEYWGAIQFICWCLLDVVEHMSKAGVVHNDIKPENFLVNKKTGEPVLIDLGFWFRKDGKNKHMLGTRGFAPEQDIEKGRDERSDVFTIGASIVSGVDDPIKLPSRGLTKGDSFRKDREGNMRRIRGNYSVDTAYTRFINSLMVKDRDGRVYAKQAKNLDFLKGSMLDEIASKEVIKKALSLASIEKQKPREKQWKQVEPQVVLSKERRKNTEKMLEAFKNNPDLEGYAKLRNESKVDPELEGFFNGDIRDLIAQVEQDVARRAEKLITEASWFVDAERISKEVFQTAIKSGVDKNGDRCKDEDKETDMDDELLVTWAKRELSSCAKVENPRRYADEAEAFLRKAGTLKGGIYDDDIAKQVQQVKERAAVARRMVEIDEADLSSSRKPENNSIPDRALDLELQLLSLRKPKNISIRARALEIERQLKRDK